MLSVGVAGGEDGGPAMWKLDMELPSGNASPFRWGIPPVNSKVSIYDSYMNFDLWGWFFSKSFKSMSVFIETIINIYPTDVVFQQLTCKTLKF